MQTDKPLNSVFLYKINNEKESKLPKCPFCGGNIIYTECDKDIKQPDTIQCHGKCFFEIMCDYEKGQSLKWYMQAFINTKKEIGKMEFSKLMHEKRKTQRKTLRELSINTGVDFKKLADFDSGRAEPYGEDKKIICSELGICYQEITPAQDKWYVHISGCNDVIEHTKEIDALRDANERNLIWIKYVRDNGGVGVHNIPTYVATVGNDSDGQL